MNSLIYVSAVTDYGSIAYREVSIGGPSITNNPDDDVAKFCGKHVVVVDDKGKGILFQGEVIRRKSGKSASAK